MLHIACLPSDDEYNCATSSLTLMFGDLSIALERDFLAVDVTIKGERYRVFNRHPE